MPDTCLRCGRGIEWNDGAACWVVPNQALPPACRLPSGEVVRGHLPDLPTAIMAHASELAPGDTEWGTCLHCGRTIVYENGVWIDPLATGDDAVWREMCDSHEAFIANHEPGGTDA